MILFLFVVVAFVFVVCLVGWFLPEHCGHHAGLHYRVATASARLPSRRRCEGILLDSDF